MVYVFVFSTLNLCLRSFVRNKRAYLDMRADKTFGVLPHPSILTRYKNRIPQNPGIQTDILAWMDREATRLVVQDCGRMGGLILDEIAIQVDKF